MSDRFITLLNYIVLGLINNKKQLYSYIQKNLTISPKKASKIVDALIENSVMRKLDHCIWLFMPEF